MGENGYENYISNYDAEAAEEIFQEHLKDFIEITQNLNYKGKIEKISLAIKIKMFNYNLRYLFSKYITKNEKEAKRLYNKLRYRKG